MLRRIVPPRSDSGPWFDARSLTSSVRRRTAALLSAVGLRWIGDPTRTDDSTSSPERDRESPPPAGDGASGRGRDGGGEKGHRERREGHASRREGTREGEAHAPRPDERGQHRRLDRDARSSSGDRGIESTGVPTNRTELLEAGQTPEAFVKSVLDDRGGRVRQRVFVDELGWSAATTSRLLSDLEDEGVVVRYRIGRENVVCLPELAPFVRA